MTPMKNVTLSADEALIEQARLVAKLQHKTLNAAFREWLHQYAAQSGSGAAFDALMGRLRDVQSGRHFTRNEMNEREIFLDTNVFLSPLDVIVASKGRQAATLIRDGLETRSGS